MPWPMLLLKSWSAPGRALDEGLCRGRAPASVQAGVRTAALAEPLSDPVLLLPLGSCHRGERRSEVIGWRRQQPILGT